MQKVIFLLVCTITLCASQTCKLCLRCTFCDPAVRVDPYIDYLYSLMVAKDNNLSNAFPVTITKTVNNQQTTYFFTFSNGFATNFQVIPENTIMINPSKVSMVNNSNVSGRNETISTDGNKISIGQPYGPAGIAPPLMISTANQTISIQNDPNNNSGLTVKQASDLFLAFIISKYYLDEATKILSVTVLRGRYHAAVQSGLTNIAFNFTIKSSDKSILITDMKVLTTLTLPTHIPNPPNNTNTNYQPVSTTNSFTNGNPIKTAIIAVSNTSLLSIPEVKLAANYLQAKYPILLQMLRLNNYSQDATNATITLRFEIIANPTITYTLKLETNRISISTINFKVVSSFYTNINITSSQSVHLDVVSAIDIGKDQNIVASNNLIQQNIFFYFKTTSNLQLIGVDRSFPYYRLSYESQSTAYSVTLVFDVIADQITVLAVNSTLKVNNSSQPNSINSSQQYSHPSNSSKIANNSNILTLSSSFSSNTSTQQSIFNKDPPIKNIQTAMALINFKTDSHFIQAIALLKINLTNLQYGMIQKVTKVFENMTAIVYNITIAYFFPNYCLFKSHTQITYLPLNQISAILTSKYIDLPALNQVNFKSMNDQQKAKSQELTFIMQFLYTSNASLLGMGIKITAILRSEPFFKILFQKNQYQQTQYTVLFEYASNSVKIVDESTITVSSFPSQIPKASPSNTFQMFNSNASHSNYDFSFDSYSINMSQSISATQSYLKFAINLIDVSKRVVNITSSFAISLLSSLKSADMNSIDWSSINSTLSQYLQRTKFDFSQALTIILINKLPTALRLLFITQSNKLFEALVQITLNQMVGDTAYQVIYWRELSSISGLQFRPFGVYFNLDDLDNLLEKQNILNKTVQLLQIYVESMSNATNIQYKMLAYFKLIQSDKIIYKMDVSILEKGTCTVYQIRTMYGHFTQQYELIQFRLKSSSEYPFSLKFNSKIASNSISDNLFFDVILKNVTLKLNNSFKMSFHLQYVQSYQANQLNFIKLYLVAAVNTSRSPLLEKLSFSNDIFQMNCILSLVHNPTNQDIEWVHLLIKNEGFYEITQPELLKLNFQQYIQSYASTFLRLNITAADPPAAILMKFRSSTQNPLSFDQVFCRVTLANPIHFTSTFIYFLNNDKISFLGVQKGNSLVQTIFSQQINNNNQEESIETLSSFDDVFSEMNNYMRKRYSSIFGSDSSNNSDLLYVFKEVDFPFLKYQGIHSLNNKLYLSSFTFNARKKHYNISVDNYTPTTTSMIKQAMNCSQDQRAYCKKCDAGFVLGEEACFKVQDNCLMQIGLRCAICKPEYLLVESGCKPEIQNLSKTSAVSDDSKLENLTNSSAMKLILVVPSDSALFYDPFCFKYLNGVCSQCIFRYFYNSTTASCKAVQEQCNSFHPTNGSCIFCFSGYILKEGRCY